MLNKIMLIDDDYSTNFYHRIIITDENLTEELIICTSVDEAIAKLSKMSTAPELIFLDMNMPIKNAWNFLEEYEEKKLARESKVIILSTTKNPDDIEKAKENHNVNAFLTKPLDLDFIKSHIEQLKLIN